MEPSGTATVEGPGRLTTGLRARWWAPGVVVGLGAGLVAALVTSGWYAYEADGCGAPGAMFACLLESLVGAAAALVLGPLLLWWAYRRAGVRRALLSVLVALAVAAVLPAGGELLVQLRLLGGRAASWVDQPSPLLVGGWVGVAALAGGTALQGPRRRLRGAVATLALLLLAGSALALVGPADRARDRLELDRAEVPLLLPVGWWSSSLYVGVDGALSYDAVPDGWPSNGFLGVDVRVEADVSGFGDTCSYRPCEDVGDVRAELPEDGSLTAWRVVDGYLVTATRYSEPADGLPRLDPVEVLQLLEEVDGEQFLDHRFDEPWAATTTGDAGSATADAQRT